MSIKVSIGVKITILVAVVSVASVILVSIVNYRLNRNEIIDRFEKNVILSNDAVASSIESEFSKIKTVMELIATSSLQEYSADIETVDELTGETITEINNISKVRSTLLEMGTKYNFKSVILLDDNQNIIYATDGRERFQILDQFFLVQSREKTTFSLIQQDTWTIYAGTLVETISGDQRILIAEIDISPIYTALRSTNSIGETSESLIARATDTHIQYQIPFRNDSILSKPIPFDSSSSSGPIKNALSRKKGSGFSLDYRNQNTLSAWTYLETVNWGLVTKVDESEVLKSTTRDFGRYLILGLIIAVLAVLLSVLFSRYLLASVNNIKMVIGLLSQGVLPTEVKKETHDEIGEMATSLDDLVKSLRNTANFAQSIGEGNFKVDFRPKGSEDTLGLALLNMRDNLVENERKDQERNWIVTGLAELSAILRMHDNLHDLGDEVIKYMADRIEAVQGAFYITVDDEEIEKSVELLSLYAYNRKKYKTQRFQFAEGLVGQAVAEKNKIHRTEIPDDFLTITSGLLGEKKPDCILIVPLITDEQVYGVIEFAGFRKFDERTLKFLDEVSVIIARTVFNIKVAERTRRLLEESTKMSHELQEKQESLRQNAEEMQATQEELENSNKRLNEQIEEVNRTQNRMQLLLENASEVITIYETDSTVRYISPSVLPILGYSQKEMIGNSDKAKVHETMVSDYNHMFVQLLENPSEQITVQYQYRKKSGEYIWLESTGTNFLSNPAINGIIVNSRDITERRRAEQEQRMRSKMQALSENSPDLITRLENNRISYINPVIEELTGKVPSDFLDKEVKEVELGNSVIDQWLDIVEQVNAYNHTISTEMEFPTLEGNKIMQVNAIPEYDDAQNLESVLVVSHDITTRKLQEIEIQNQNKKIADSINYSKRIQSAILPNNSVINRILPNSFILYKPKDIVSGDFPWFAHVGKYVYVAAVDCTGHGVPGALLSLIGYFLLNDIVRSRKVTDPGEILDQLDEGVTTTLKQDQADNTAKDGMDIAFCRLDLTTNEVVYAGAHRPLYIVQNGVLEEIKGNKFAIGGGIYKNQTNFTSHTRMLSPGDSFYFCSDGFPDQFGGPEIKKFGPRRLRELIETIHTSHMKEASKVFDETWTEWMGNEKQMDDVLLIGIKF